MELTEELFYDALVERHGPELQEKFHAARVAVCGLGGLGSNIAIALARAGVGALHLIDFDRVDISNLNRQQYFVEQLGAWKTEALAENLSRINPWCRLTTQTLRVTEENIPELFHEDDVICEAFDKPEAKAMLVQGVLEHWPDKPLVSGVGMAGMSSANLIRTRRVSKNFYLSGDGVSESGPGTPLISARVAVCAGQEAFMVLRILAGEREP